MKRTVYILVFVLCVFLSNLNAQDYSYDKNFSSQLGFAAGRTIGFGISYRFMPVDFGVQATVGSFYNDLSIGFTPMIMLQRNKIANLFLYNGNSFYKDDDENIKISNSFGIGIDLNSETPFTLSFMGGIASHYELPNDWTYSYTLEIAVLYKIH